MIVQCAKCGTKFRLDEAKIGPKGAKVRCAKCQHGFIVTKPAPEPVPPPEVAAAPDMSGMNLDISLDVTKPFTQPMTADTTAVSTPELPPPRPKMMDPIQTAPLGEINLPSALEDAPQPLDFNEAPTAVGAPAASPSVHTAATAIYQVPAQFRNKPLTDEVSDSGVEIDLDADELPTRVAPAVMASSAPAVDLTQPPEVDDAMLVDDADVTALASVPEQPKAVSLNVDEPFADPFAGMGGLSADGTVDVPQEPVVEAAPVSEAVQPVLQEEHQPAPGRNLAERPSPAPAPVAPIVEDEPSLGLRIAVRVLIGLVLVAAAALGVLTYWGGGRIDLGLVGLAKPRVTPGSELTPVDGVSLLSMRSVLYPVDAGRQVLVFVGEAQNQSQAPQKDLDAVAELVDQAGRVLATERAPLGIALTPADLAPLSDRASVQAATLEAAKRLKTLVIPAGGKAPFSVVIVQPPLDLESMTHRVRLEKGAPYVIPVPPPPPEPVVSPVEPTDTDPDAKLKGKKALKAKKGLKGKGKRKGKAVDAGAAPATP